MATDLSICQSALTRLGASPITSFADGTAEAIICANNWPDLRRTLLTEHPWNFATTTRQVTLLSDTPATLWDYAYQLPGDCLDLRSLTVERIDTGIAFDRMGSVVLTNEPEPVYATFIWEIPEGNWPAWFVELAILRLAGLLALGLTERAAVAVQLEKLAAAHARIARYADARTQTNKRIPTGRLVASRY
jgi:hypothetical protein